MLAASFLTGCRRYEPVALEPGFDMEMIQESSISVSLEEETETEEETEPESASGGAGSSCSHKGQGHLSCIEASRKQGIHVHLLGLYGQH